MPLGVSQQDCRFCVISMNVLKARTSRFAAVASRQRSQQHPAFQRSKADNVIVRHRGYSETTGKGIMFSGCWNSQNGCIPSDKTTSMARRLIAYIRSFCEIPTSRWQPSENGKSDARTRSISDCDRFEIPQCRTNLQHICASAS